MYKSISWSISKPDDESEGELFNDKYLADFIKMHEYKLQSKILKARADKIGKKLAY
jgi:hypothetical protein